MRNFLFSLLVFCLPVIIPAQASPFADVVLMADTAVVRFSDLPGHLQDARRIPFYYRTEQLMVNIRFVSKQTMPLRSLEVASTPGINIIQNQRIEASGDFMLTLSLEQITTSSLYELYLKAITPHGDTVFSHLELLPVTQMSLSMLTPAEDIFIGEEMVYELNVNLPENLVLRSDWTVHENFYYRISRRNDRTFLHLVSLAVGRQSFTIESGILKPEMDLGGNLLYKIRMQTPEFNVKAGRLAFLGLDLRELSLDLETRYQGTEVQIDNHRMLQMNKTYRIEAQEEEGGALIAELFVKSRLANNKVLAILRPYNYHQSSGGYLYIKDGDQARFITNFSIIPQTAISKVKILREGREWSDQIRVNPNETAIIRLEGESLSKGRISFDIPGSLGFDTLVMTEREAEFRVQIPLDVPKTRLDILINGKPSGHAIQVVEFQRPRSFDFIKLDYGYGDLAFAGITGPIFHHGTIRDIRIGFNPEMIDQDKQLFGKQYLNLQVKVHGAQGQLIESFTIENVVICPAGNSPRYAYYSKGDCRYQEIMLNQYLSRKSYDWDIWTRVVISFAHVSEKYQAETQQKTVEIILQRPFRFDVDVSFPAGLLIVKPGQEKLGTLSGISMAMVAQFSFYYQNQIAKPRPFKIGAGFLALNAFNFSEDNTNRDMGVVLLASVYPTRRDVKMSFPLYLGAGYFLNQKELFFLLGPGIRVSF